MGLLGGKLFTTNVSSPLKTQHALLQLLVFITFPKLHVLFPLFKFIRKSSGYTPFITTYQIVRLKNMHAHSLYHNTFPV